MELTNLISGVSDIDSEKYIRNITLTLRTQAILDNIAICYDINRNAISYMSQRAGMPPLESDASGRVLGRCSTAWF